jgi:hypothetical protein
MKKLLVLALALSMANMANAATLVVNESDPTVEEIISMSSDILLIDIVAEPGFNGYECPLYLGMLREYDNSGSFDISQAVIDYLGAPSDIGWEFDTETNALLGVWSPSIYVSIVDIIEPYDPIVGTLVSNIMFHDNSMGTVRIGLFSGEDGSLLDSMIVYTGVPEPITMVLLGLGGLMLRRRK